MAEFIITYHDGYQPETQEEGQKLMAEWMAWVEASQDVLKDKGNPVGVTNVMTKDDVREGVSKNPLMGYSIIEADSMEDAIAAMKGNPHLTYGGTIEVSQIMAMPDM